MIRAARAADVPALVALEQRCFTSERLSRRSIRHFLASTRTANLLVDEDDTGQLNGYALVLFRRNTSLARLYSIAVDPPRSGSGIGRSLLAAAERAAVDHGATRMRLEVHVNNSGAQKLYRRNGYRDFAVLPDYYDGEGYDGEGDALRMEKTLAPHLSRDHDRVAFYRQTLEFTCGPASLMMAMATQAQDFVPDRGTELRIWREATTVFMTSGHGGCGAIGLALAAWRRGFDVELSVTDETGIFLDSVRSEEKKDVIRLVEEGFLEELEDTGIRILPSPLTAANLRHSLAAGGIPVVLISSYRLTGERVPHWVVVTAADDRFVYINDPYVDVEGGQTQTDCMGLPIAPGELERMMSLGRRRHAAAVIVYRPRVQAPPAQSGRP